ncbi:MAG: hypothetical protein RI893_662 [Pseudomonadota bacterium]
MGSLLSVLALGTYVAYEQGELATKAAHRESYLITSGLATALASDLIIKNYGGIDQTIIQFTTHLNLDSFLVANGRGNIIVKAIRDVKTGTWELLHGGATQVPVNDAESSVIQNNHIVTWAPVMAGSLIGWVHSDMLLDQITATQHQILIETILVAFLAMVLSTFVVVIALRRPVVQIRRATNFARRLPEKHGQTLGKISSASELQNLFSALNSASEQLHHQDQELKMLNTLIEYTEDPIYIIDVADDFRMTFANDAACRHYGLTREKLLTLHQLDWDADINSEQQVSFWTKLKHSGHITYNSMHRISGGKIVPVEISANYIQYGGRELIAGFFRDIRERVKVEQELRASRDLAQHVAKAKTQFLANMSHEIRTPMNAIIGFSELAMNKDFPPQALDYLGKINRASNGLMGILNDILDFSKLEEGQLIIEHKQFHLDSLLDTLYSLFDDLSKEKGLILNMELSPDVPLGLIGDAPRLQQVLINLLGNAIKFTAHGTVTLKVTLHQIDKSQARLLFSVIDTGIGISAEDHQKLFQPFSQVDGSITRRFGGTGLGLAISHNLVQLMGSEILLKSTLGLGSCFSFELVLDVLPLARPYKIDHLSGTLAETLSKYTKLLTNTRILVAEDNLINQQVVSEFLALAGISVEIANNGKEALALLTQSEFDAVLMDMHMPVMDGFEATKQLRNLPRFATLPVLALSAGVTPEEQEQCLAVGISDFIAKPINPVKLLAILARWLRPDDGLVVIPADKPIDNRVDFDEKVILVMLGNNQELATQLLSNFKEEMKNKSDEISAMIKTGDLTSAKTLLHGLKGAAGNIGAVRLYATASILETELKEGLPTIEGFNAFNSAFNQAMAIIADQPQISIARSGGGNPEALRQCANELEELIKGHDFIPLALLNAMRPHLALEQLELFTRLCKLIQHVDYNEAHKVLRQLVEMNDKINLVSLLSP